MFAHFEVEINNRWDPGQDGESELTRSHGVFGDRLRLIATEVIAFLSI